ncbi:MAG: hypothetical protein HKM93_04400 [Desulfobacteraceae bacterium]|nr:hypothetical protein [Desulfobacteraceae bacterium]
MSKLSGLSMREISQQKLHHGNGVYLNPFNSQGRKSFLSVLKWKMLSKNHFKKQYATEVETPIHIDFKPIVDHQGASVTFIAHASVMIKDQGHSVVVDPVFYGLFPTIHDFSPLTFDISAMPVPDHVLITHGHYDHLDKESLKYLSPASHVIAPLGYEAVMNEVNARNHTALDWYDRFEDANFEIILLPCNHWTMRNPIVGPNHSLWGAYLVKTPSGLTIFISGDTAYYDGFKEIGEQFDIDLAILSLGAYEPRWFMKDSHMNPPETVRAFQELRAGKLLIVHWGTFRLGDEPVYIPPIALKAELRKQGLMNGWIDLSHGETYYY